MTSFGTRIRTGIPSSEDYPDLFEYPYHPALTVRMVACLNHLRVSELLEIWQDGLRALLPERHARRWYQWLRRGVSRHRHLSLGWYERYPRLRKQLDFVSERILGVRATDLWSPIESIGYSAQGAWGILSEAGCWEVLDAPPAGWSERLVRAPYEFRWTTLVWWLLWCDLWEDEIAVPHVGFPSFVRFDPTLHTRCSFNPPYTQSGLAVLTDYLRVPLDLFYAVPVVVLRSGTVLTTPETRYVAGVLTDPVGQSVTGKRYRRRQRTGTAKRRAPSASRTDSHAPRRRGSASAVPRAARLSARDRPRAEP